MHHILNMSRPLVTRSIVARSLATRSFFVRICVAMAFAMSLFSASVYAYEKEKGKKNDKDEKKSFESIIKDKEFFDGFFDFYRDKKNGKLWMAVAKEQLGKEFIYFTVTMDGVLEASHFRGQFRENTVMTIRQHFDRLEFVEENTYYLFDSANPMSRASAANISPAVLASAKVSAESKDKKTLLIEVGDIFLSEALHQISPTPNPKNKPNKSFKLGELAKNLSKIQRIRSYPKNSDITVDYIYKNKKPLVRGSFAVTNPRSVSVSLQHSFIQMPEEPFEGRIDDPRVGYFNSRRTDLTSDDATPYKDLVHRWNLVKKDPEAAVSEPVSPIVWWIENTTPLAYRESIRQGALAWNEAFESAGFKNAIVVNIQPDDAEWDAGDIRYNVLRWTSSPNPLFGGYGPSFVNPRTGQILGADIMLENIFITRRLHMHAQFDLAGRGIQSPAFGDPQKPMPFCSMGHHMKSNLMFGRIAVETSAPAAEDKRIVDEALKLLTLHEIGHTLGLNHNMRATGSVPYSSIYDSEKTQGIISASVMDYHAVNLNPEDVNSANFFQTRPGTYDHWAIRFAYAPELNDPSLMKAHMAESTRKDHIFGNDADDMRSPGRGNDPRVMIGDLSDDPIAYSLDTIRLTRKNLQEILNRYKAKKNQSWQELHNAYLLLTGQQNIAGRVISRYIGGIYQDRAYTDQKTEAAAPFEAVPYAEQKRAMTALQEELFAPSAFAAPENVLSHLQRQRRGFDHFGRAEDPLLHSRIISIQMDILGHLTHPNTLRRLTDSRLYGNTYSAYEMLSDLTDAVFLEDIRGDVNTQRQALQIEFANRLMGITRGMAVNHMSYDHVARNAANAALHKIANWVDLNVFTKLFLSIDDESDAHRLQLRKLLAGY